MSEKPVVSSDEIFARVSGKPPNNRPTTDAQTTDNQQTDDAQTTDTRPTEGETPRRQVRLPDEDWTRLQQAARRRGISASALVRLILREWIDGA